MSEPSLIRVTIDRLGRRGEGIARTNEGPVFVPYALPGERVGIDREGERGAIVSLLAESPERVAPICPYYGTCGGCAVQAWAPAPYAAWKRQIVVDALAQAKVPIEVAELVAAHGDGRRRATFHARTTPNGAVQVGFMQARAHTIVEIASCPILAPGLGGALDAARAVAKALAASERPLDLVVLATETGIDLDLRGHGALNERAHAKLIEVAQREDLARLANHGVIVIERRKPVVTMGHARLVPPPGAFLQATAAGEAALVAEVTGALKDARKVADLFAGVGTFALRLAERSEVAAFDSEAPALVALDRAARETSQLRAVRTEARDLFRRPLASEELNAFEAVVLDPPRAGAEAQMRMIAASRLTTVVSVACDATSFARDAAILVAAGFKADQVVPVDQFLYSAHVEMVATFRRPPPKRQRRLLG